MSQEDKKKYEEIYSKSSQELHQNLFAKFIKSGKTISQMKRMNAKQFNKAFGTNVVKKSSLEVKKRVIIKMSKYTDEITTEYIQKEEIESKNYQKFLYNEAYELFRVKEEERKDIEKLNELESKPIEKEGSYGVVKIIDLKDSNEYFIKYNDDKSLRNRLESLKSQYKINNWISQYLGTYMYKEYIEEKFRENVEKVFS